MGRYLAGGIPAYIYINGKNENFDKSKLKKLHQKLSEYISLNLYEHKKTDGGDIFFLKNISKKEIYETLSEFKKVTKLKPSFFTLASSSNFENILSDNYKFKIVYNYENYGRSCNGVLINDEFYNFDSGFYEETWLYKDCNLSSFFGYDVQMTIEYLPIWQNIDKINIENETVLLSLLNKFKIKNFSDCSDLTKSILFYISG